MTSFVIPNKQGYKIKCSPIYPGLTAVATNENFGFSGSGWLHLLQISPNELIEEKRTFFWPNALFAICWIDKSNTILTGSGDGSLQIWTINGQTGVEIVFKAHDLEVSSIDCHDNSSVITSSWDSTIKLWDINRKQCIITYRRRHHNLVHESKVLHKIIASVSEDCTCCLWDIATAECIASFRAHDSEVLSCDWSKFNANLVATSGSDGLIRCWDIRNFRQPTFQIKGSSKAVKEISFSPHFPNILASGSCDFLTKIWDARHLEPIQVFNGHSNFVYDVDWCWYDVGQLVDCSWDSSIKVYRSSVLENIKNKM
ncbi:hypothetical protein ABEB36_011710 [Hypothenemus hampei]|uniref:Peroxin-7 n=1 Tax=Hypothenemus hampei TaxID=57062 RepID=A0ABD1EAU7_HYPHA